MPHADALPARRSDPCRIVMNGSLTGAGGSAKGALWRNARTPQVRVTCANET
jgi:hypothetical protein